MMKLEMTKFVRFSNKWKNLIRSPSSAAVAVAERLNKEFINDDDNDDHFSVLKYWNCLNLLWENAFLGRAQLHMLLQGLMGVEEKREENSNIIILYAFT